MLWIVAWIIEHYQAILAVLSTLGLGSFGVNQFNHWRLRRADEKRAAAELVPRLTEYKVHWIDKYYADRNAEPNPNPDSDIDWKYDPFEPLLSTPALSTVAARLSRGLRDSVHRLHALALKWKGDLDAAYEWNHPLVDVIGPLAVTELAVDTNRALKAICKEAGVSEPDTGHDIDLIVAARDEWRAERVKFEQSETDSAMEFLENIGKDIEALAKPSTSRTSAKRDVSDLN
jgi:hypothetical protein